MKNKLVQVLFTFMALILIVGCSTKKPNYAKIDTSKQSTPSITTNGEQIKVIEDKSPDISNVNYNLGNVQVGYKERGFAGWYGKELHGEKTVSGEIFNMYALTAAHRTLPMGTIVKITNLQNGKNVVAKINDRGPYDKKRIIDLSYKAALNIGITSVLSAEVELEVLGLSGQKSTTSSVNNVSKTETVTKITTKSSSPVVVTKASKTIKSTSTKDVLTQAKKTYTPKKTYVTKEESKKSYPPKTTSANNKKIKEEIINDYSEDDEQVLDVKTKEEINALKNSETKKTNAKSNGEYCIQLGSFKNYDGANSARKSTQDANPSQVVLIKEAQVNGETFYRVIIVGFDTKTQADSYKKEHNIKGYVRKQ